MRNKKLKIGCIVSALLLITVIPLSFAALSAPIAVGVSTPQNDEILTEDENLETAGILSFHVEEFDISIVFGNMIRMRVKIENQGGFNLQLVQVKIRMTLNDGSVRTFTKFTGLDGYATMYFLNLRLNTKGRYTCTITGALFLFGFMYYDPSENEASTTKVITL